MSSSVETATALGPVMMLPLLLFGGFFVNNEYERRSVNTWLLSSRLSIISDSMQIYSV